MVTRRQPVLVSIENGEGTGFDLAYDGYSFLAPYDAAGSKVEAVTVGSDTAYDFTIERQDTWVSEGRVGIRAEVPDGYSGPTDRDPSSGEAGVSRDAHVEFRVTESG